MLTIFLPEALSYWLVVEFERGIGNEYSGSKSADGNYDMGSYWGVRVILYPCVLYEYHRVMGDIYRIGNISAKLA